MKKLIPYLQEAMYQKRRREGLNFEELAAKLNCTHEQMIGAQIGNLLSDEVYKAVTDWIGETQP